MIIYESKQRSINLVPLRRVTLIVEDGKTTYLYLTFLYFGDNIAWTYNSFSSIGLNPIAVIKANVVVILFFLVYVGLI